jgi:glycine hydroxymethyltransferase
VTDVTDVTDPLPRLERRPWLPDGAAARIDDLASSIEPELQATDDRLASLIERNREIHEIECVNLNPAANVMNPRAEAMLSANLGSRPSLGYPGEKYEMGLEAVEEIEVIAAELAARVFRAPFAEVRVGSGALANLYAFMACAQPGDAIIVPPASIAGHVTHHSAGAAGLYGLEIHEAPIDPDAYTVDLEGVEALARRIRPAVISLGSSLNLTPHPVAAIRAIADDVGATVLFDAAHLSGLIAGGAWPDPLSDGAHVMTMSTYKSLGGPPSGLLVTTEAAIAQRIETIAFPGLTANFDVAKTAALALTLLDWLAVGSAYANEMVATATALADELLAVDVDVHLAHGRPTQSHAFAVQSRGHGREGDHGDGHALALRLRRANLLTSAIGVPGDAAGAASAIRLGTNEMVRWGMTPSDMPELAALLVRALHASDPELVAADVGEFRRRFDRIHFVR